jgi:2-dehydropantoate 2-reductase
VTESADQKQLRVGVVGAGPVGLALAVHLIEAGAFVVVCDIDHERIDAIKADGIKLDNTMQKQVDVTHACYDVADLGKYDLDLVAVATKAPSLKRLLPLVVKATSPEISILCVQNGLDNEREAADLVGADRILRMVVNYAGGMSSPNTVHMIFFNAPNYVAALTDKGAGMAQRVADLLTTAGLATEVPEDIRVYTFEKAILNAALAPVCSITRLTMKQVMETPDAVAMVKGIIDESVLIAEAEGIKYEDGFGEFCLNYLKKGGDHRPSMAIDLEQGLATEIDYMNGRIAAFGEQHGLPTPYNQTITALVHMLERSAKETKEK